MDYSTLGIASLDFCEEILKIANSFSYNDLIRGMLIEMQIQFRTAIRHSTKLKRNSDLQIEDKKYIHKQT